MSETKKCKICGEEKELSEFYSYIDNRCKRKHPQGRKCLKGSCKPCDNRRKYEWGRKKMYSNINGEQYRKHRFYLVSRRARSSDIDFELTPEDIKFPDVCPVLGIKLSLNREGAKGMQANPNAPSIDRFDNSIGYTKENVRFISFRANRLKADATFEEIEALYNWMKKELGKE
jgi:hypothetical protein